MSIKTGQFIKLCEIIQDNFFSLQETEVFLEHTQRLMVGFLRKKLTAKSC